MNPNDIPTSVTKLVYTDPHTVNGPLSQNGIAELLTHYWPAIEAHIREQVAQEAPSRFHATPAEINAFLLTHFAEDTLLRYQHAIGNRAVAEAARDIRMDANMRQLQGDHRKAEHGRQFADLIDPLKGGGNWPTGLVTWQAATTEETGR